MELVPTLFHLAMIHLLMAMVPGPNTVTVGFFSVTQSRKAGLAAAAGVSAVSVVWVTASLAGIGLILMQAGWAYRLARLCGGAYLIYAGVKMFRSSTGPRATPSRAMHRSAFLSGALTTLGNPKSAVFWTSVFTLLLPLQPPAWFYAAVTAIIAIQSMGWYATIAVAVSSPTFRKYYQAGNRLVHRVAGVFMVGFGLKIFNDLRSEII